MQYVFPFKRKTARYDFQAIKFTCREKLFMQQYWCRAAAFLVSGFFLSIIANANNNNHSSALACDVIGFNVIDWDTSESKAIFTQSIDQFEGTFLSVYILYETINRYSKKRNLLTHIMEIADGLIMVQNCQLICDIYVRKNISPGKWYIHISLR